MRIEKSCGAVVFTRDHGLVQYLIIQSKEGFYGFPKGHIDPGEQEEETALREIWEETGLRVELVEGFRTEDVHLFLKNGEQVMKRIVYFLGKFSGQVVRSQESELTGAFLMDYPTAMKAFQYESSRRFLKEANDYILSIGL